MEGMFSFKDLEKVSLKATYNMKIGEKDYLAGETIALFDNIQLANFRELTSEISANGGYENRARVFWKGTSAVQLQFTQGVFSKEQFGLMINARAITNPDDRIISISEHEELESDEDGTLELKHVPKGVVFIYKKETGELISDYELENTKITISVPFCDVIVNYVYEYSNLLTEYLIGQSAISGFVELEGRTRIKDDVTGQIVTGILKIPHLRLMSDLSIRLGAQASPVVGNFKAEGVPVGSRGNTYVGEFYILGDDIESDL